MLYMTKRGITVNATTIEFSGALLSLTPFLHYEPQYLKFCTVFVLLGRTAYIAHMRPTATDVAWSVCLCVCGGHTGKLYKNE